MKACFTEALFLLICLMFWVKIKFTFALPYLFDCKLRLIKFFHHFVRLIIKSGLQSKAAYIYLPYRKYRWRSVFPWLRFYSTKPSFHILPSAASRAHSSQEGLWWTEGSCGGEALLPGLTIKRESCQYAKVSQGLRKHMFKFGLQLRAAYINF